MTNARKISFEMGNINLRNGEFDHHSEISHSQAFIAKMASIQLLEWMFANRCYKIALEVNHAGHLDDIVAFSAEGAYRQGKFKSLYKFACQVSVLDSCGPLFKGLLSPEINNIIEKVYTVFQAEKKNFCKELGCKSWELPLEKQVECSKRASLALLTSLEQDKPEEEKEKEEKVPPVEKYSLKKNGDIAIIELIADGFNPFVYAEYFYKKFNYIIYYSKLSDNRYKYTILCKTPYHGDLTPLWEILNKIEPGWGGHSGAGGSPRDKGSDISPSEIMKLL